jgi:indole-3-glycerol phosphate synthase
MHPGMILNVNDPEEKVLADRMAGAGYVSIILNPKNFQGEDIE